MLRFIAHVVTIFCAVGVLSSCEAEKDPAQANLEGRWQLEALDGQDVRFFPPPSLSIGENGIELRSDCSEWRWERGGTLQAPSFGDPIPVISCDLGLTSETEQLLGIVQTRPEMTSRGDELIVDSSEGEAVFHRQQ